MFIRFFYIFEIELFILQKKIFMDRITSFEEYQQEYKKSVDNPEAFWASKAEKFSWYKKWDKVLEWNFKEPSIKWFIGGKLNITVNCLDRHLIILI